MTSQPATCVEAHGVPNNWGYGRIKLNQRSYASHRLAYMLVHGPIPRHLQIDHICRNRKCINVSHLQLVTPKENTLSGNGIAAKNSRKTHCNKGHEFSAKNTFYDLSAPNKRRCRICRTKYQTWRNELVKVGKGIKNGY